MQALLPRQFLCGAIETALNAARPLFVDPDALIASVEGDVLAVTLKELRYPIQISVHQGKFMIRSPEDVAADCHIITDFETLPQLQQRHMLTKLIREEKLDLEGDLDVAQRFAALFNRNNVDIEEWLSRHIGDVAAYKMSQAAQQFKAKVDQLMQRGQRDIKDYLVDEINVLPEQNEYRHFANDVDDVAMQLSQTEARINALFNNVARKN